MPKRKNIDEYLVIFGVPETHSSAPSGSAFDLADSDAVLLTDSDSTQLLDSDG